MDPEQTFAFEADLWVYSSEKASWHFVTVPPEESHRIRFLVGRTNGFGSVRVRARIGGSRWSTSLFPDKASGCYFLPLKAAIRNSERITTGDRVRVELTTG